MLLKGKQMRHLTMKFWKKCGKAVPSLVRKMHHHVNPVVRTFSEFQEPSIWPGYAHWRFNRNLKSAHLLRMCLLKSSQAGTFCKTGSNRKDARELSTGQDLFFFTDQKNDPKKVMASHILSPKKKTHVTSEI